MPLQVVHLVGSAVSDFLADLSRLYAGDCLSAVADGARYQPHIAYVSPDGTWRFPVDLEASSIAAAAPLTLGAAVERLEALHLDVVVPQMFCRPGMTVYRALFDVLGIPYVGNPADVMALGADKAHARSIVAAAGVSVPQGEVVRRGAAVTIAPPVVVKPVDSDNSLGVTLVRHADQLDGALSAAFDHSGAALVERYVELGREVRCGILVRDGQLICLPLEEYAVDADSKPIRDHADKLARTGEGELNLVAKDAEHAWIVDPADPVTERVWDAARRCHVALGCRDYSLFDFRIDAEGEPWFLEASLYNSFARKSVLCVMAAAAGIGVPEFFDLAVRAATTRLPSADDR